MDSQILENSQTNVPERDYASHSHFTRFAAARLNHGDLVPSLEECLRQWRADREFHEAVADVRQSLDDCAAGNAKPIDQAFDDVRRSLRKVVLGGDSDASH